MPQATKKSGNITKLSKWIPFSSEAYQEAATYMVHFSAKTVNSNTLGFGIRLAENVHRDIPYLAVSTLTNRQKISLDFYKGGAQQATRPKQINAVRQNTLDQYESVPQIDREAIAACADILSIAHELKEAVGIRLRQIILQDTDGNDIAATPLPCAGFSVLLTERIQEERDRENPVEENSQRENNNRPNLKGFIRRKRAYLSIGGANPQNVGLNMRAMHKPLMCKVPTMRDSDSQELRQALAIYHRGVTYKNTPLKLDTKILSDFIVWRQRYSDQYFVDNPTNLNIRKEETRFLTTLTYDFVQQIEAIQTLLHDHLEKLPEQKLYSPALSALDQGLLDSTLRDMAWRRNCAIWLHTHLLNQTVWLQREKKTINRSRHETAHWTGIIEGVLA